MAGTHIVLVTPMALIIVTAMRWLICRFIAPHLSLAATLFLARRTGRDLKSMSWSSRHGYTAEFFPSKDSERRQPT